MKNILTTWAVFAVAFLLIGCEKKAEEVQESVILLNDSYLIGGWSIKIENTEGKKSPIVGGSGTVSFEPDGRKKDLGELDFKFVGATQGELRVALQYDGVNRWEIRDTKLLMTFAALESRKSEIPIRAKGYDYPVTYSVSSISQDELVVESEGLDDVFKLTSSRVKK